MPKYGRKHILKQKKIRKNNAKTFLALFPFLFLVSIVVVLAITLIKMYSLDRFTYVEKTSSGGAVVHLIDSKNDRVYEVLFSENIEVDLSYSLGKYKLSSAWILGDKEGYGGDLIAKSIVKNFHIPVYLWKDDTKSNLNLFQKVKVSLINKGVSQMTTQSYTVEGDNLPFYVLLNFSNEKIAKESVKLEIVDGTGSFKVSSQISPIIEVMGAKVANYSKVSPNDSDCIISGSNKEAVEEFSKVFSCEIEERDSSNNIDVKLTIGKKFLLRY